MTDRESWTVTTHDWSESIDEDHLLSIRRNPEVFSNGGVRHLILEVLAYANDEAESVGRMGRVTVAFVSTGEVTVVDEGRGTDTRLDAAGRPVRKPIMSTRDVRFFDAAAPPLLPDGLARRGMSVVAALSSVLIHENRRTDGVWSQTYRHGIPDEELRIVPSPHSGGTGTTVSFIPDPVVQAPRQLAPADYVNFSWLRVASTLID